MVLQRILTHRTGVGQQCWKIAYEWEDILSKKMDAPLCRNPLSIRFLRGIGRKLFGGLSWIPVTSRNSLAFVMVPGQLDDNIAGKRNIVPVVIDFWEKDDSAIRSFATRYAENPAVLITSREVYDYLKPRVDRLKIFHWPLSIPDEYVRDSFPQDKKYDCIIAGRTSRVLVEWARKYAKLHGGFRCVYHEKNPQTGQFEYFDSDGSSMGSVSSRDEYFKLLRSARVGLYSTPGIDNDKNFYSGYSSNGYNQVTPRFLEYLASGCHVLARYQRNSDTDYYEMDVVAPHVESYEEFEQRMDIARTSDIDCEIYRKYLFKHTTSSRCDMLIEILKEIEG